MNSGCESGREWGGGWAATGDAGDAETQSRDFRVKKSNLKARTTVAVARTNGHSFEQITRGGSAVSLRNHCPRVSQSSRVRGSEGYIKIGRTSRRYRSPFCFLCFCYPWSENIKWWSENIK